MKDMKRDDESDELSEFDDEFWVRWWIL